MKGLQMKIYAKVLVYFGVMDHAAGSTPQITNALWKIIMEFHISDVL